MRTFQGGERKRDREGRRRALVQAAMKLFAQRGYEPTTTREISAKAGCAEGLIHRYFDGKAGLLAAIVDSRVSQEVINLNENLAIAPSLEEEIRQLVEWEIDRMWEEREFLKIVLPRAILEPKLGELISKAGPQQRARAIAR